jgi:hypothetical protein
MISRSSSLEEIKRFVKEVISEFYDNEEYLFHRNHEKGLCERCLAFRFAHLLQNKLGNSNFVDCDYDSAFEGYRDENGYIRGAEKEGKPIRMPDGRVVNRLVDIIVHKRDYNTVNDFICFEIKKWRNTNKKEIDKDKNNLKELTSSYGYLLGFHLSLGHSKNMTKWSIFHNGNSIVSDKLVFQNARQNQIQAD